MLRNYCSYIAVGAAYSRELEVGEASPVGWPDKFQCATSIAIPAQPGNQPLTDGELYWKITHGVGKMPAFAGKLTDTERWLVVDHLRSLPPVSK